MRKLTSLLVILISLNVFGQEQITLNECYQLLDKNYPLAKQTAILEKQHSIDLAAIKAESLPLIDLSAQATYQSDVIEIPISNAGIEPLNKDQYRTSLSASQLIYGGGLINAKNALNQSTLKTGKKTIEVNLYQLKKQVNQIYFSVLLAQEKQQILALKQDQLAAKLKEVRSGIKNGIVLPASDKVLEAEILKVKQQFTELEQNKLSLIATLSSLIGKPLSNLTLFQESNISIAPSIELNRPELELFELKKEEITSSEILFSKQKQPKLSGFAEGGYGNPGLNMLDNSFQPFYIAGLKLKWNVFDGNANKKHRESIAINKDLVDNEMEIFKLNTNIELDQTLNEIDKIALLIVTDKEIIALRQDVLSAAESQLKNGVITSSAYITELTNLYEDQNTLATHSIQLQLAKSNYNITKGL